MTGASRFLIGFAACFAMQDGVRVLEKEGIARF
jgi:hypothetical protein